MNIVLVRSISDLSKYLKVSIRFHDRHEGLELFDPRFSCKFFLYNEGYLCVIYMNRKHFWLL